MAKEPKLYIHGAAPRRPTFNFNLYVLVENGEKNKLFQ